MRTNLAAVFGSFAVLGAIAAAPAIASATTVVHVPASSCSPNSSTDLSRWSYTDGQIECTSTSTLWLWCPFRYDTAFLDSSVAHIYVDLYTTTGGAAYAETCYTAYDSSAQGCSASASNWGTGYNNPAPSVTNWSGDSSNNRYTSVFVSLSGANKAWLQGVYVSN